MKHKKLYDMLLNNGELYEVFPQATADWEKDKKQFILEQEELENLIKDWDVEIED